MKCLLAPRCALGQLCLRSRPSVQLGSRLLQMRRRIHWLEGEKDHGFLRLRSFGVRINSQSYLMAAGNRNPPTARYDFARLLRVAGPVEGFPRRRRMRKSTIVASRAPYNATMPSSFEGRTCRAQFIGLRRWRLSYDSVRAFTRVPLILLKAGTRSSLRWPRASRQGNGIALYGIPTLSACPLYSILLAGLTWGTRRSGPLRLFNL